MKAGRPCGWAHLGVGVRIWPVCSCADYNYAVIDITVIMRNTFCILLHYYMFCLYFPVLTVFLNFVYSSLSLMEDSLHPNKSVLYSWDDPVGSKMLKWKCGKNSGEVTQKDVCIFYKNSNQCCLICNAVSNIETY